MKKRYELLFALLIFNILACFPAAAATCESLASLSLAHTTITLAEPISAGTLSLTGSAPIHNLPAFCRVTATLTPSPDSTIKVEVWMPVAGWNGKYEGTGNGGYGGRIAYDELATGLRRGYAVANTDMGTAPSTSMDGDALIGHPEKWIDWGWRSTHAMTVAAKEIVAAYYGHDAKYSYFQGCSTGGEQALMEAQRFPDDYDGIIAGAPANNRTRLHMTILWNFASLEKTPASRIPAAKLPAITQAILTACPAEKAVASDSFLSDPEKCHWDPQTLLCKAGDSQNCLTAEQVTAVRDLYNGPRNSATRASIYPGIPRGSEFGWNFFIQQNGQPPFDSLFQWVFGPVWNWRTFDFNRDAAAVDTALAPMLNATNPDLNAFKEHGHKLIVYHGWADWLVAPQESVNYYNSVLNAQARAARRNHRSRIEETQGFYRLFMVPGMSHCSGGPGFNTVDPLPSLERWVEKGIAPEKIVAKRENAGATEMTRPVCPYPQSARYNGSGNPNDFASFSCTNASPERRH